MRPRIVTAIDSLKGCLTTVEANDAAAAGVRSALPDADIVTVPVSDGGEGMLAAFTAALDGNTVSVSAHDPLMRPIKSQIGLSPDGTTAIVESAQAIGLSLLATEERNPLKVTSYGLGELILAAINHGAKRLITGLGGSATSDCGVGMLSALGIEYDERTATLSGLSEFALPRDVEIVVASDVNNPLYGDNGAAKVFAAQKGATAGDIEMLDSRARRFAHAAAQTTGRDCSLMPGAGAAGGTGYALMQFLGAKTVNGAELLLDLIGFDSMLENARLVVTGEGKADAQTLMGKLPFTIMKRAKRRNVPVALIAGIVENRGALLDAGFTLAESINTPSVAERNNRPTIAEPVNPNGEPLETCLIPEVAKSRLTATIHDIITHSRHILG